MANISIVNYCNLKCPYCFANDMIDNNRYTMTSDELVKILDLMGRTNEYVGIIGGEPTLHPKFDEILNLFKEYKLNHLPDRTMNIFTNGIEFERYVTETSDFFKYFSALLNINHPDLLTNEQIDKTRSTLNILMKEGVLNRSVIVGFNLYPSRTDYQYIWDLAKEYDIKELRISTIAPGAKFKDWRNRKEEYYTKMKEIFFKQCKLAEENGIYLDLDCNNVPLCYFDEDETKILEKLNIHTKREVCENPVVDIIFGNRISACFGAYDLIDPVLFDFDDMEEVRRYLRMNRIYPKIVKNGIGKCKDCDKYKLMQCQGGCLGFATE